MFLVLCIVAVLLVTGGVEYRSPRLKLEVAQIDVFALFLAALVLIRKIRGKKILSKKMLLFFSSLLRIFEKHPRRTVWVTFFCAVFLQSWVSIWRYTSFHANAFDLSYVDQALYNTVRGGGFLHSSLSRGATYLGEHFALILVLPAQLYRVFESVYALFIFQSFILCFTAWLVYWLARLRNLSRPWAALLAVCALLYQPLRAANQFDFREDSFFISAFLGMFIFYELRARIKWWWVGFAGLGAVSWTIKENAPIFTALIALWLAYETFLERKKSIFTYFLAGVLLVTSVAVFAVVNMKITPHFAGATETKAVHRLGQFGKTNREILMTVLQHPVTVIFAVLKPVFHAKTILYLLQVLTPFALFMSASWPLAIIVGLGLLMNIIVNVPTLGFHYECILIPFLFYILIRGIRFRRVAFTPTNIFLVLLSFFVFYGRSPVYMIRKMAPTARHRFVESELRKIPVHSSVTTQSALHSHMVHRKDAFLFSPGEIATDYAIFDFSPTVDRYGTPNLEGDRQRIEGSKKYRKILDQNDLVIYQRL